MTGAVSGDLQAAEPTEQERQAIERDLHVRRFDDAEMNGRLAGVRSELEGRGVDAMLLTDEVNVTYFTGMATPSFTTRARPLLVVIPVTGSPVLICSRSQSANARAASAITDVRPFERFEDDAIDVAVDVVHDLGLSSMSIGCELGPEQRLGLTYNGFDALRARLPHARFVDASAAVWATRAIKSAAEISRMRRAGTLNSSAMDGCLEAARPGATELDVHHAWAVALAEGGADRAGYLAMHSGPGNYRRISSSATSRRLQLGDLVWMDGGPVVDGYWSDITRMVSVGPARPRDRDRYAFAWQVVQQLVDGVEPGQTAGDVARRSSSIFSSRGLPMGGASRIGHGIGAELTEPPSIVDGDETVLRPGMTLSIETGLAAWDGYFLMEENIVITEHGAERLSTPAAPELPVVA